MAYTDLSEFTDSEAKSRVTLIAEEIDAEIEGWLRFKRNPQAGFRTKDSVHNAQSYHVICKFPPAERERIDRLTLQDEYIIVVTAAGETASVAGKLSGRMGGKVGVTITTELLSPKHPFRELIDEVQP